MFFGKDWFSFYCKSCKETIVTKVKLEIFKKFNKKNDCINVKLNLKILVLNSQIASY